MCLNGIEQIVNLVFSDKKIFMVIIVQIGYTKV
jgi:hypothetical protein